MTRGSMHNDDAGRSQRSGESPVAGPAVTLDADVACRGCGYNLRGLSTAGRCPECGVNVWISAAGQSLKYANPTWLAQVVGGARMIVQSLFGYCGLAVSNCLASAVGGGWMGQQASAAGAFLGIGFLVVTVWLLYGLWRYTSPEPARTEGRWAARRLARIGVIAGLITTAAFVSLYGVSGLAASPYAFLMCAAIGTPFGLTGYISLVALAYHTRELTGRAGDHTAARTAAIIGRVYAVAWPVTLVAAFVGEPLLWVSVPGIIVLLSVSLMILGLPHDALQTIRKLLCQARRHWRS